MSGNRRGRPPMRGSSRLGPRTAVPSAAPFDSHSTPRQEARPAPGQNAKLRVVFVCIGNSCRSQMAEVFAKAYGGDIIDAVSAGISPAPDIAMQTKRTLAEKNFSMDGHFPKGLETMMHSPADLIVNMSGLPLAVKSGRTLNWQVQDPIGQNETVFRRVAGEIEQLVMRLILELRAKS
jgi:arsenate reductase (thioredoxin)